MKIECLPEEDNKSWHVFACYDGTMNEVKWTCLNYENMSIIEDCQFKVFRRGNIVIVQGYGWPFHFKLEINDDPDVAVILAAEAAGLAEAARE